MEKYLHVGCGKCRHDGLINLTQQEMDITKPWPYQTESIDGVISMQVLQQLYWRDLMKALKESFRVLKKGGLMRAGTMFVDNNKPDYALGWDNINLFSFDLLKRVLEDIGYSVRLASYQDSAIAQFKPVDNRPTGVGTSYIECKK